MFHLEASSVKLGLLSAHLKTERLQLRLKVLAGCLKVFNPDPILLVVEKGLNTQLPMTYNFTPRTWQCYTCWRQNRWNSQRLGRIGCRAFLFNKRIGVCWDWGHKGIKFKELLKCEYQTQNRYWVKPIAYGSHSRVEDFLTGLPNSY